MNYYDAHEIMRRRDAGQTLSAAAVAEASAYLATHRPGGRVIHEARQQPTLGAEAIQRFSVQSPMQALCECGKRFGQHRVNDYACPNQEWSPGNGKPQWLKATFQRKQSPTAAKAAQP